MDINERIRLLRESVSLTQEEFGKRLGVSRSVIKNLDYKKTKPKDLFIEHLCNTFKVNHEWLETGKGDMFVTISEYIVDKLIKEYNLDDVDDIIIRSYLNLSSDERSTVKKCIINISNEISNKKNEQTTS